MKSILFLLIFLPLFSNAQIITTVAGNGVFGYSGDGGPATAAAISAAGGIAFGPSGDIYFSGYSTNTIRKISSTGIITTIAGNGVSGYSGDGGPASAAQISFPVKICRDAIGDIYIADQHNHRIRKIAPSGIITTFAGNGSPGYSGDGGPATNASLLYPSGVTLDSSGNVLIVDCYNNRVRKVSSSGIITTIVGNGIPGSGGDGGMAIDANLQRPFAVTVDAAGNLYISDQLNSKIRKVSASGIITTFAGTGVAGFSGDGGPATAAAFNCPGAVAIDSAGNFFIDDFYNYRVRKIDPSGIVTTVIGNGTGGFTGDGGPASAAEINLSNEIVFDHSGQMFIGDNDNYRIRRLGAGTGSVSCLPSISSQPVPDTVIEGTNAIYTVMTTMLSASYQWQEDPGAGFVDLANVWPYSGVTTNELTIHDASIYLNATHYRCVINDTVDGVPCLEISSSAILIVGSSEVIGQLSAESIAVFPNPAEQDVLVKLPSQYSNTHIRLINSIGQVVTDKIISGSSFSIDVSKLLPGVYIMKMECGNQTVYKKIFKD